MAVLTEAGRKHMDEVYGEAILAVPMQRNDSKASTIGGYLVALARKCWEDEEEFSGKRPFGNSGWHYEVYTALIEAGLVHGKVDDGMVEEVDDDEAERLVGLALDRLVVLTGGSTMAEDKPALDQIIDKAEGGESWTFTRDGKPVAIIIGWAEYEQLKADQRQLELARTIADRMHPR